LTSIGSRLHLPELREDDLLDPLLKLLIVECILQVNLPDILLSDLNLRAGAIHFGLKELLEHRVV
jgi:hypothetical protein